MKKLALIVLLAIGSAGATQAQDYKTAIGLRAGAASGISVKHFLSDSKAIEGILSTRWQGFNITGLYEIHKSTNTAQLNWYYGYGAHIGFWNGANVSWADDNDDYSVIGIDGVIGLEYTFKDLPINVSLDWKPAINLIGYSGFWADGFGLSVRYTL